LPAFAQRKADSNAPIKPFDEPLITVTFDDGWESIYSVAMPIMQKNGVHSTQYILSATGDNQEYMSSKQIKMIRDSGDEITCHGATHIDLTVASNKDLLKELTDCKQDLQKEYGVTPQAFASPYGRSNTQTISAIKGLYTSHRNTDGDISNGVDEFDVNTKAKFNRYDIIAVTVRRDTPLWQIEQAINYTIANNGWLVLNYHQIDDGPSEFGLDQKTLENQIHYISGSPVRIVTMSQVINAMQKSAR